MNFSDYIIDKSDFDFFESLDYDEKLLFLYDLICEDEDFSDPIQFTESDIVLNEFETILKDFENKLYYIVASCINYNSKVNILVINNQVILNSESLYELNNVVRSLFLDGYILQEHQLNNELLSIFHQQRYCKVFNIIGQSFKIKLN
jgi:hypothetical protein